MYGKRKWNGSGRRSNRGKGRNGGWKRRRPNESTINSTLKILQDAFHDESITSQSKAKDDDMPAIETSTLGQYYRDKTNKNFKYVLQCTPTMFLKQFPEHFVQVKGSCWRQTTEEEHTQKMTKSKKVIQMNHEDRQYHHRMQCPLQGKSQFTVITNATSSMEKHAIRRALSIVMQHSRRMRWHPRVIVCGVDCTLGNEQQLVGHTEIVEAASSQLHNIVKHRTKFDRSPQGRPRWPVGGQEDPDFEFSAVIPEDPKDDNSNGIVGTVSIAPPVKEEDKLDDQQGKAKKQEKSTKTRLDVGDFYITIAKGIYEVEVPFTSYLATTNTDPERKTVVENSSWHEVAWIVAHDPQSGIVTRTCSAGFNYPNKIVKEIRQHGFDTNDVGFAISERLVNEPFNQNVINGQDPFMDLSGNVVGRGHLLESALIVCLSRLEAMKAEQKRHVYYDAHMRLKQEYEEQQKQVREQQRKLEDERGENIIKREENIVKQEENLVNQEENLIKQEENIEETTMISEIDVTQQFNQDQ